MSSFIVGRFIFEDAGDASLPECVRTMTAMARSHGITLRCPQDELHESIGEILNEAYGAPKHNEIPFLLADGNGKSSDDFIDVHDDLVGSVQSVPEAVYRRAIREAVYRRAKPIEDFIVACCELSWFRSVVIVCSEGFGINYRIVTVAPNEIREALASAYEDEEEVPSLGLIVSTE